MIMYVKEQMMENCKMENISRLKFGYEPSEKHDMLSIGTFVNVL